MIGSLAALVLGLLVSSANSTYETQSTEVKQVTASIVLLDRTLSIYGREADSVRTLLRGSMVVLVDRIWRENSSESHKAGPFVESDAGASLYDHILKLTPQNDAQRLLQARAIDVANDVSKARLLLFAKAGGSIPIPFLAVLILWLTIIFVSFSLFADMNKLAVTALCIFALSASASLFLILELSQPFTGLMMIPSDQLRNALAPLAP